MFLDTLEAALRARRATRAIMSVKGGAYEPLGVLREYRRVYEELMDLYKRTSNGDAMGVIGVWKLKAKVEHLRKAVIEGFKVTHYDPSTGEVEALLCNAFVNQGLNNGLDRWFGLGGTAISHMGLSSDNTATTAASTTLGGTVSIKAISPAASRSAQTVTAGATWTQADSPGPATFSVRKSGLLIGSTDAVGNVQNIIGGAGSSPYNKPFTIDFTTVGTFSQTLQNQVTLAAV